MRMLKKIETTLRKKLNHLLLKLKRISKIWLWKTKCSKNIWEKFPGMKKNTSLHFAAAKFNFIISLNFLASQVGSFQILSLILVQKCNDILRRTFCAFQVFFFWISLNMHVPIAFTILKCKKKKNLFVFAFFCTYLKALFFKPISLSNINWIMILVKANVKF